MSTPGGITTQNPQTNLGGMVHPEQTGDASEQKGRGVKLYMLNCLFFLIEVNVFFIILK